MKQNPKKNNKMSKVSLGTLYDLNKNAMKNIKELTYEERIEKRTIVEDFIKKTDNRYYMLLCNDRRDFTVITLLDGENKSAAVAFTVIDECLVNRGKIKAIDLTDNKDAIEIWLNIDNEEYCYYFFPYDSAIVEV